MPLGAGPRVELQARAETLVDDVVRSRTTTTLEHFDGWNCEGPQHQPVDSVPPAHAFRRRRRDFARSSPTRTAETPKWCAVNGDQSPLGDGGTVRTGHGANLTTFSATEPTINLAKPVSPFVERMMRSMSWSVAKVEIS